MAPAGHPRQRLRGTPPRTVRVPKVAGTLPYFTPRRGRHWLLLPDTWASRLSPVVRFAGVLTLLVSLLVAAFYYEEFDRARRRLALPFNAPRLDQDWSRPGYVAWRRSESLHGLKQCALAGAIGAAGVVTSIAYDWRRRRRALA